MDTIFNILSVVAAIVGVIGGAVTVASFIRDIISRRKGLSRIIFIAGPIVIICLALVFLFIFTGQRNSPAPLPNPMYQSQTDIPDLSFEITWENTIIQNQSISLSCNIDSGNFTRLAGRFGPKYDFFLLAQLHASSLTIDPKDQVQEASTQQKISFTWTATPTLSGKQAMNIDIIGIWVPQQGGNQITRFLGNHLWYVTVDNEQTPFFAVGQLSLGSLLTVLFTSLLTIPVWDFVKGRIDSKKKEPDPELPIPLQNQP